MEKPTFVYTTYIRTTAEKLWQAITKPEFARQYWGGNVNVSDWNKGSKWEHIHEENSAVYIAGEVVESDPPKRLVLSWVDPDDLTDTSLVTLEIEPLEGMVSLKVTHGDFAAATSMQSDISRGWPLVLSSLKSYLETGEGIDIMGCKKRETAAT